MNININFNLLSKIKSRLNQPVFNTVPVSSGNKETATVNLNNMPEGIYGRMSINPVSKVDQNDYPKHTIKNYTGCLLGGAAGDALGAPVEFYNLKSIKAKYGEKGISDLKTVNGKSKITDDTQMTIFTADGLIKSALKKFDDNIPPDVKIVHNSYLDWLATQNKEIQTEEKSKGWIADIPELYSRRAPGNTCLGGLMSGKIGTVKKPLNNSKGCGGVMRTAPAGLMYYKNDKTAFETGVRCAAITHGSPDAYLPAGVHSAIISNIIQGKELEEAVDNSIDILKTYKGNDSTLYLLNKAKEYAKSDIPPEEAISELGEGWYGDEAIAISVYCALKSPDDFQEALRLSVNHSGDSDSTGAITGNILGAYLGEDVIPLKWKENLELSSNLRQLSNDLFVPPKEIEDSETRYPVVK